MSQAEAHPAGLCRRVAVLLGDSKSESTLRYLGIELDDAMEIVEQTEMRELEVFFG